MTRKPDWTREPFIWNDHGQPACTNQAEEEALLDELAANHTPNTPDTPHPNLSQLPNDAF